MNTQPFIHDNRGKGRPQVLLIGNGLERGEHGQPEWSKLLDTLAAPGRAKATQEEIGRSRQSETASLKRTGCGSIPLA